MNSTEEIQNVIASRDLEFVYAAGGREAVRVSLGGPVPSEEPELWWCPYLIKGTNFGKSSRMAGIDAVQALTLTLATIPVELDALSRKHKGAFRFLGEPGHLFAEIPGQA